MPNVVSFPGLTLVSLCSQCLLPHYSTLCFWPWLSSHFLQLLARWQPILGPQPLFFYFSQPHRGVRSQLDHKPWMVLRGKSWARNWREWEGHKMISKRINDKTQRKTDKSRWWSWRQKWKETPQNHAWAGQDKQRKKRGDNRRGNGGDLMGSREEFCALCPEMCLLVRRTITSPPSLCIN